MFQPAYPTPPSAETRPDQLAKTFSEAFNQIYQLTKENAHLQMVLRRRNRRIARQMEALALLRGGVRRRR